MLGFSPALSVVLALSALPGGPACDEVATPATSARAFVGALHAGQTGCVRGTLTGDVTLRRDAVTLRSAPGARGRIVGRLVVADGADHVTVRDLDLRDRRSAAGQVSPLVLGDDARFAGVDVANDHTGICFVLGASRHDGDVLAERTLIEQSRIHDCGTSNNHQHGIYVEHADGARIVANAIYDNADRAVQLYPSAQNSLIAGNVIDGNGEGVIFSGLDDRTSSGNVVRHNIIANARLRSAVESFYPPDTDAGTGNVVEDNCLWGRPPLVATDGGGFVARRNVVAEPRYVNRAAGDLRLAAGSACAGLLATGRAEASPPA